MAQCKTCNQVSYHVVLLSPLIIFPSSLVDSGPIVHHRVYKWIILIPHPSKPTLLQVTHGPFVPCTIFIQHLFQINYVVQVKLSIFHGKLLKYHVVLSQGARLIRQ